MLKKNQNNLLSEFAEKGLQSKFLRQRFEQLAFKDQKGFEIY
jgi:hypothetical protein